MKIIPCFYGLCKRSNVSEIKRVKGGGVEVKLFDRLKALEKLYDIANSSDSQLCASSFIEALKLPVRTDEGKTKPDVSEKVPEEKIEDGDEHEV